MPQFVKDPGVISSFGSKGLKLEELSTNVRTKRQRYPYRVGSRSDLDITSCALISRLQNFQPLPYSNYRYLTLEEWPVSTSKFRAPIMRSFVRIRNLDAGLPCPGHSGHPATVDNARCSGATDWGVHTAQTSWKIMCPAYFLCSAVAFYL